VAWVVPLTAFRSWRPRRADRPLWPVPAVVTWAGARGVVPLAATLSIPIVDAAGRPVPQRDLLLVLATAVIVISLVVQGFTLAPLVRRAGLAVPREDAESEYARARLRVAEAGLAHLDELDAAEAVPPAVLDRVRRALRARFEPGPPGGDPAEDGGSYHRVRRDVVAAETEELARLYAEGAISEATRRRVQRQLDLEDARYSDDH
jgi:monovalent cation/hydrogen antiporter